MPHRSRRAYDHRIERIIRAGNPDLLPALAIPRSTAMNWIRRGPREVVSLDPEEGAPEPVDSRTAGEVLAPRARAILRLMEPRRVPGGRGRRLRPALEPLVRQLAELPEDERREVVAAAQESAARHPVLSWDAWDAARGLVSLGGDAVADCDRLYDGS